MSTLPRIAKVKATLPTTLKVTWRRGGEAKVDLAGWIATGSGILAPLQDAATFKTAHVGEHGASVEWDNNADLAIDAVHLARIAEEQRALGPTELADWQAANNFTNDEAALLLGVGRSTWAEYKSGKAPAPATVVMTVRLTRRDPTLIHAHFRPLRGKSGRPPKHAD